MDDPSHKVTVHVETWRLWTYFFFWTMCIVATVCSKTLTHEYLIKGVDKDVVPREQWGCGPFNREGGEFGLEYGDGFDYNTQSHLKEALGYANICANWDYPIAREITAMYFPFFEYSLIVYLVLDFVVVILATKRGDLPQWFLTIHKVIWPLNLYLTANFRMIFVSLAYEQINYHTAGFLALQFTLAITAISNSAQVILIEHSYPTFKMNKATTRALAYSYLSINMFLSCFKIAATAHIVRTSEPMEWTKLEISDGFVLGRLLDYLWMAFNAILPVLIACVRRSGEDPVIIEFTMPERHYDDDDAASSEITDAEEDDVEAGDVRA